MLDTFIDLYTELIGERNSKRRRQFAIGLGCVCIGVGAALLWIFSGKPDSGHLPIAILLLVSGVVTLGVVAWFSRRQQRRS